MGQKQKHALKSDPNDETKKKRRVGFSGIDAGVEAKDCIRIFLVSSKEEFDAPESFIINPVDLNSYFDDDGKIYGYEGLKIKVWVSRISFYAYADIAFESSADRGKGITDLKVALQAIFAETLVDNKDEFLQKYLMDKDFVRKSISTGEVLKHKAFKHADSDASNVEVVRLKAGNMATGQLYSHIIPLVLLLVDGSSPIDVTDPMWELYVVVQKKTDQQGEIQCLLLGFTAIYRFYHYPDNSRLRLGQILVLPPYQHKGYGRYLLEVLNDVAIAENVFDLTVEEPLDNFQHVRSCVDTQRLLRFEPIQHLVTKAVSLLKDGNLSKKTHSPRLTPPPSAVEDVRKNLKITKTQFLKCWEVLIYIGLNPIDKYLENFVSVISERVKYDILGKDSGTAGKQLIEVPCDVNEEMSFVMFKSGAGEDIAVQMDDNQTSQEEQLRKLVQDRVKEIQLIAKKIGTSKEYMGSRFKKVDGSVIVVKESDGGVVPSLEEEDSGEVNLEEKKENEPFAVPTAGAFYMHDDRFRDNSNARQRRMRGGRRLWESKDDKKWGHDKFEEISVQDRRYDERRPSRGNFRGRGRIRGTGRGGHVRGNRREYNDREYNNREYNNREYNEGSNQNQVPKVVVKGRGPRRYEPTNRRNGPAPQVQNKQSRKSQEKTSRASSERNSIPSSNAESDPVPAKKTSHVSSNLNYASPPFYPSGSSNKEINLPQKRDVQIGSTSRNIHPVMDEGFPVQQNNTIHRGKNVVDSISMDKLYIEQSVRPSVGKPMNNVHLAPPGSSGVHVSQSPFPRPAGPGRGAPIPLQMNYQPVPSHTQVNKVSPTQLQAIQRSSAPGQTLTSVQATAPQMGHRPGSGSQSSSPPKRSASINSLDSGETDVASESGKAKGALVGKGNGAPQGPGRGPFVYGGAQVMGAAGNMGISQGDPNFPTFLPVMQFGGQHPGGMGVPAVGMAFPGYVANPQLGLGKSEMTWLPVLAGAAGALGAQYCSPYLAVDGAYSRQPGQTSAIDNSSKENVNKANNELKPPQKTELVNDEYGQRQNKPRRYSEMNFGQ